MFKMTKNIAAIFAAIMLLAQIGIAQHNVGHFTDHGHYEHGLEEHDHEDKKDHKKGVSEACQLCLLTKSLSSGLLSYHADLSVPSFSGHDVFKSRDHVVSNLQTTPYIPRGPPALLI